MGKEKGVGAPEGHWMCAKHFTNAVIQDLNLLAHQKWLEKSLTFFILGPTLTYWIKLSSGSFAKVPGHSGRWETCITSFTLTVAHFTDEAIQVQRDFLKSQGQ